MKSGIQNLISKIRPILGKKRFIIPAIFLILVGGVLAAGGGKKTTVLVVDRGDVREEVLVTGKTKAASEVDLGFDRSGRVVTSNVSVGDKVTEGKTLVVLDQSDLLAKLSKAESTLKIAELDLGNTTKDTQATHSSAVNSLIQSIRDAYVVSDDAVRNNADQFFTDPRTIHARFDPSFTDGTAKYFLGVTTSDVNFISDRRERIEKTLTNFESNLTTLNASSAGSIYQIALDSTRDVQKFLDEISLIVNSLSITELAYEPTLRTYRNNISTSRTAVSGAISTLISTKEAFDTAPTLANGSGVFNDVLSEQARVEGLEADVQAIRSDLSHTVLTAPISGVITRADAKRGEIVSSGETLVSIISDSKFQIEANVSEVNIGKVGVGDLGVVKFDAFPRDEYPVKVVYIDPGETLVDGIATYKVTAVFDESHDLSVLKSGLTANLRILTEEKKGVIRVPAYAVERKDDKSVVMVKGRSGDQEERVVEVGLRGNDGYLEIISGLEVGEEVIVTK